MNHEINSGMASVYQQAAHESGRGAVGRQQNIMAGQAVLSIGSRVSTAVLTKYRRLEAAVMQAVERQIEALATQALPTGTAQANGGADELQEAKEYVIRLLQAALRAVANSLPAYEPEAGRDQMTEGQLLRLDLLEDVTRLQAQHNVILLQQDGDQPGDIQQAVATCQICMAEPINVEVVGCQCRPVRYGMCMICLQELLARAVGQPTCPQCRGNFDQYKALDEPGMPELPLEDLQLD